MKIALVSILIGVAALVAGCATANDAQSASEPHEQREYRTGSNLPVRVVRPKTKEERDRAAEEAEQATRDAEKIVRPGS